MTNSHPSLQPRLSRSNVDTMLRYMAAEIEVTDRSPIIHTTEPAYRAGYTDGVNACMKIVRNMWLAAEIATDAIAQTIEEAANEP